jgi:hypothetical protein
MQCGLTALTFLGGLVSIDPDVPSTEIDKRIDWLGAILVTSGLVLIVFVLGQGEVAAQQWATPCMSGSCYIIHCIPLMLFADIIALLIIGVFLVTAFVFWERYLEKVQNTPGASDSLFTPPPLVKPSVWGRARGRFAVMLVIAFLTWCSFFGWNLWVQVMFHCHVIIHIY